MFHKQHHKFIYTTSIAAEHAHPIEQILVNNLAFHAGPILLGSRFHMYTFMIWGLIRHIDTHEAHSGYDFPFSMINVLPFGTGNSYHFFHHTKNVGNYSTFFTVWDIIFDSNVDYYEKYGERESSNFSIK